MVGSEFRVDGSGLYVAVIVSRFNEFVTEKLLAGAEHCLEHHGCTADRRLVVRVAGAWELPQAAQRLARRGGLDAIIALGAVIRGETPHFEYIAAEAARGLARVALDTGVPTSFGVLTTDTVEQALARAGGKSGNKGWDAALAGLELARLFREWPAARPGAGERHGAT
jgi:6,7-dimethyl-8-ribityllumazine synthase